MLLLSLDALAAPPSSTLSGPDGTLSWEVSTSGDTVTLKGSSPKWQVTHTARADLTPVSTTRVDPDGRTVTVTYTDGGATVKMPDKTLDVKQDGLWDGDTLDIRLGHLVTVGRPEAKFSAIDTGSGKVYAFDSQLVGTEACGATPCTHVLVQLRGMLRWVGPSFHYWFGADGKLLKFEGPAGTFTAGPG